MQKNHRHVEMREMLETARFMTLPGEERARLAKNAAGKPNRPPWLDDDVMEAMRQKGWIEDVPTKAPPQMKLPPGTIINVVRLTAKGHAAAAIGDFK